MVYVKDVSMDARDALPRLFAIGVWTSIIFLITAVFLVKVIASVAKVQIFLSAFLVNSDIL
jgi:hypothetical protein